MSGYTQSSEIIFFFEIIKQVVKEIKLIIKLSSEKKEIKLRRGLN